MVETLPSVRHYSWWDIPRKIRSYRGFWQRHWESLYDVTIADTAENNMFFNKTWAEVQDDEIAALAKRMSEEMGGWVFHSKIDFNRPTPSISVASDHPVDMTEWIGGGK
jgi:hypothetical protein